MRVQFWQNRGEEGWRSKHTKVLKVQERIRVLFPDRGTKLVDKRVVLLPAQPGATEPKVQRVVEKLLVVGSDIEDHRKDTRGVDSCQRRPRVFVSATSGKGQGEAKRTGTDRVDIALARGDQDSSNSLVSDSEDTLAIRDDDEIHLHVRKTVSAGETLTRTCDAHPWASCT